MASSRFLALALAAAALTISACGGADDSAGGGGSDSSEPAQLTLTVEENGRETGLKTAATTEAGPVELEVTNNGKRDHSIQLVRVDEGNEATDVLEAGEAWASGKKPLPEFAQLAGGSGTVKAGRSTTTTLLLEPGNYVALDVNAEGAPPYTEFEATGEGGGELPSTDATIEAKDYSFTTRGLKAGTNTVTFANTGRQPHVAEAIGIKGDATIEDVKRFFETEKGEPPIDDSKTFGTAIVDGGQSVVQEMELEPGRYVMICFVPDREGGPPHLARGMVSEVEVK